MAIDKCKPLKIESPSLGGTQLDIYPTEVSVTSDYLATKGLAFENLETHRIEKLGRIITELQPDGTIKPYYDSNYSVTATDYFNNASQITANRIARKVIAYDASFSPTSEITSIYDTDGTTVLRSSTATYSYTSYDLTNVTDVTT